MARQSVTQHLGLLEEANLIFCPAARAGKAALLQPGPDPRNLRALDLEI
jgi:hypothetical protein